MSCRIYHKLQSKIHEAPENRASVFQKPPCGVLDHAETRQPILPRRSEHCEGLRVFGA